MSIGSILAAGRARRQALMRDTVTIREPAGRPLVDQAVTVERVYGPGPVVYQGIADFKPAAASGADEVDAGEESVGLRQYEVGLPYDAAAATADGRFRQGLLVTLDQSDDGQLVGRTFVVDLLRWGPRSTARQLIVTDEQAPA